jgi:3-oxoacyl-[acyl-carrier-protein] synthase-3
MSDAIPCIGGVTYAFPGESRAISDLAQDGALETDAEVLRHFGFDRVFVADEQSPYALAREAGAALIAERALDPESIGLLIYAGSPSTMAFAPHDDAAAGAAALCGAGRFSYPGTRLQYELGLERATVIGIDQFACTSLFAAIRVARALMSTEGLERSLCVAAEFYPRHAGREALYNCTSDAACAVLLERTGERNRLRAAAHVTKGYYWDVEAQRDEIIASYFPTATHVIGEALARAGWHRDDVDWVIPHNVSLRSWQILLGLARLGEARLWSRNIARTGHTLSGDNFINLRQALDAGDVRPGDRVLMFSYGYGAHWTALAMEA